MTTPGRWRKSSRSAGNSGNCVEARLNGQMAQVRDSKLGDGSPIISLPRDAFAALLADIRNN